MMTLLGELRGERNERHRRSTWELDLRDAAFECGVNEQHGGGTGRACEGGEQEAEDGVCFWHSS